MAYSVYSTEGIVLAKKDFGEAERLFYIFTKEFGMIKAIARGVRYIKSKLRYNLDLFCYNNFSLIKTKDAWKITDASEIKNISNPEALKFFAKIAAFLTRMIKGEEKNDFIWAELKKLFLTGGSEIDFLAKVLHNLGYMPEIPSSRKLLISAINKAIKESML
ncbi:MAG: DNA repair protein RecO [Candidatus Parcubacteria bacterium]|nr:DNA repair protein RecO [Candidatus Parcubacteria bacterium]